MADEAFTAGPEFFDARDLVQVKYEMVRRVRAEGQPVSAAAAAFGFSRPSYYQAAADVDAAGLAGLVPARPGPRRAHKLTAEVVAFARQLLDADPSLRSAELAGAIEQRFGIRVHPRSVERALGRAAAQKRRRPRRTAVSGGRPGDVARYEQLRQQVLGGDAGGWRLGLGVLQDRGMAGWLAAWDACPTRTRAAPGGRRPSRRRRRRPAGRGAGHHGPVLPGRAGVSGERRRASR